jgi:CrcB protein
VDQDLRVFLLVVIGGALGAAARFGVGTWLGKAAFPYATTVVNVSGCFVAGLLIFYAIAEGWFGPAEKALLAIGFLGAFTTMSTFSMDVIDLVDAGKAWYASVYVAVNVLGSLGAAFIGRWIGVSLAG